MIATAGSGLPATCPAPIRLVLHIEGSYAEGSAR